MTREIANHGLIIETGWIALREVALKGAPEIQVREMRKAFFSGAQHLFACIVNILDDGAEPTEGDLRRVELIAVELDAFVDSLKREARGIVDPI